jgi:hypothetical protein
MQNRIRLIVLAAIGVGVLYGCGGPDSNAPATAEEKKAFKGGPMPESAKKEFEAAQKDSAAKIAEAAAKAKAAAGH